MENTFTSIMGLRSFISDLPCTVWKNIASLSRLPQVINKTWKDGITSLVKYDTNNQESHGNSSDKQNQFDLTYKASL